MSEGANSKFWLITKTVLFTAGAIYVVSLMTWFAHWAVLLAAVGGVGFLGYKLSSMLTSNRSAKTKQLTTEQPFDARMRQLDAEDRALDARLGLE